MQLSATGALEGGYTQLIGDANRCALAAIVQKRFVYGLRSVPCDAYELPVGRIWDAVLEYRQSEALG